MRNPSIPINKLHSTKQARPLFYSQFQIKLLEEREREREREREKYKYKYKHIYIKYCPNANIREKQTLNLNLLYLTKVYIKVIERTHMKHNPSIISSG